MTSTQIEVSQRNRDVLEVLGMATPMLKRLAFQWNMEYDELFQRAACAALESYEKAQEAQVPRAFLYGVIRNVLWYKPDDTPTLSLDAPQSEATDTRLIDIMCTPYLSEIDPEGRMRKERALYAALRKLPLEVQEYLVRVHELYAYRPARPKKGRFAGKRPDFSRDPATLSRQAYHYLRRNKKLAYVVCGTRVLRETDFERDWAEDGGEENAPATNFEREWD